MALLAFVVAFLFAVAAPVEVDDAIAVVVGVADTIQIGIVSGGGLVDRDELMV